MFKRFFYIEGLTSLLYSDNKYLINILGKIKNKLGDDVPTSIDKDGHKVVHVQSWDGEREYRVIDLVALQFKSLQIPLKHYDKIIAFVIDGNKDNTHAENIGYRFLDNKLEFEECPGFYYVPGYPYIAININGDIIDVETKDKKTYWISNSGPRNIKGGYYNAATKIGINNKITVSRHRALGLVFLPFPDNVDKLTINHKDGIPGHDILDNLEWMTRSQNNIHAYVNDLKSQHMRTLARNVFTGEVKEYYSVSECSRAFGYSLDSIRFRLAECEYCRVFGDGYQFKYKDDPRDWVIPADPDQAVKDGQYRRSIKARNCTTLEEKIFDTVISASSELKINDGALSWRINNDNRKPLMGYQFTDLIDTRPWPVFTKEELQLSFKPNSFKVSARNLLTGETRLFDSARQSRVISVSNINMLLMRGDQPFFSNGWQFKLEDDNWKDLEIENIEEEIYKLTRDITALDVSTGKLIIAESAKQMGEMLKLDPKAVRVAALTKGNKLYHGYRFRLGVTSDPWPTTDLNVEES